MESIFELNFEMLEEVKSKGFEIINFLGSGSFGNVYKAKSNNKECAVKIILKRNIRGIDKWEKECLILSELNHPNIIKFFFAHKTYSHFFLFMELAYYGTLSKYILEKHNANEFITEDEASKIIKGILNALKYLHNQNIVHRDLKPDNVLIDKKNDLSTIKLADFGLSKKFEFGTRLLKERCGTLLYMAPEFINDSQYSKPVDIWSCGIIVFEIIELFHPFYKKNDSKFEISRRIQNVEFEFKKCSSLARDFILKLTNISPSERYSATQAIDHPFLTRKFETDIPFTFSQKNHIIKNSCDILKVKLKMK